MSRGRDRAWFGHLERHFEDRAKAPLDSKQVQGVAAFLAAYPEGSGRLTAECEKAAQDLAQNEPTRYHAGLRFLGRTLGFEIVGDSQPGSSDCIWHLAKEVKFNFEAKTEKKNGELSIGDVRQIKEQLGEIAANDGLLVTDGLQTTCVTDCTQIARRKAHDVENFVVARPAPIHEFAKRWFEKLVTIHRAGTADAAALAKEAELALHNFGAGAAELAATLRIQPASKALQSA